MNRACRWRSPLLLLVLGAFQAPSPLAGQMQFNLGFLSTRDLYQLGRARADRINKPCAGDLDVYLEGVAYLYAYHQAASRDGSLQSDPRFAQTFAQQFTEVVDRARRCLKAYAQDGGSSGRNSSASPSVQTETPPGVLLPDPPAPAPEAVTTDAQGRTIPQLVAVIEALTAEVTRLRNLPPATPAPAPAAPTPVYLDTEYRIRAKVNNLYWHLNFGGDNLLSTRIQSNDDFTRFIVVGSGDGAYRIRNKATGRYLYASDAQSGYLVSSTDLANDSHTRFLLFPEPDGSYRIQSQATGRFLSQQGDASRFISSRYQPEDDYARFFFDR